MAPRYNGLTSFLPNAHGYSSLSPQTKDDSTLCFSNSQSSASFDLENQDKEEHGHLTSFDREKGHSATASISSISSSDSFSSLLKTRRRSHVSAIRPALAVKRLTLIVFSAAMLVSLALLALGTRMAPPPPLPEVSIGNVVSLANGIYQGASHGDGVTAWLGMRYAAAPVGDLRFQAPQDPPLHSDVIMADQLTPGCMGVGPTFGSNVAEDCLFVDVYAPSNATTRSNLPVYVFIMGGGFNGDVGHTNGSRLVRASDHAMITVSFNYRGGALGFLASNEIASDPSAALNNGLRDQRKLLHWVQRNIAAFGGNPRHVVLGGQSAGAGSMVAHLTAYNGRDDGLFIAAAAQSQSMPAYRSVADSQYQYDNLVRRANCSSSSTTLACLRKLDITAFQRANLVDPFPSASRSPIFSYNPVVDGDFIVAPPADSFAKGRFVRVPTIFGDTTNEGTIFTPRDLADASASTAFLHAQFPLLTPAYLARLTALYGLNATTPAPYWHHASRAYGEIRYVCPGIYLASAAVAARAVKVWNYRYDVLDPAAVASGLNVPHGAEMPAIWGVDAASPASLQPGGAHAAVVPLMQGAWINFILRLDPNASGAAAGAAGHPATTGVGSNGLRWETWDPTTMRRFRFAGEHAGMEIVSAAQRERCDFVKSIAVAIAQ